MITVRICRIKKDPPAAPLPSTSQGSPHIRAPPSRPGSAGFIARLPSNGRNGSRIRYPQGRARGATRGRWCPPAIGGERFAWPGALWTAFPVAVRALRARARRGRANRMLRVVRGLTSPHRFDVDPLPRDGIARLARYPVGRVVGIRGTAPVSRNAKPARVSRRPALTAGTRASPSEARSDNARLPDGFLLRRSPQAFSWLAPRRRREAALRLGQLAPMKSRLPSSTPLWRRMS